MKTRILIPLVFILMTVSDNCLAEQKVFAKTVRYVMGENESRQELRELATLEAKRQVLEQVGVYIESTTELKQYFSERGAAFENEEQYRKEVLAITAGVTNTVIDAEEWKEENCTFVLYLTCRITVDTDDVGRRIEGLVKDRQKLEEIKMLQDEVTRLQSEMEELKQRLEIAEASKVEEIKEQRNRLSDRFTATEWFEKGRASKDPNEKILYCTFAIERNPNWDYPYIQRGIAYYVKGDYEHSIGDLNKAIQIDLKEVPLMFLGWSYIEICDYYSALHVFNDIIQINNANAYAYYNRGIVFQNIGDNESAMNDFNNVISIDPKYTSAYLNRGNLFFEKGNYDDALSDFNKVLKINPNDAVTYCNRGRIYGVLGDYIMALDDVNRAIQMDSNYTKAHFLKGTILSLIEDYDNAIIEYSKVIQENPNDVNAPYYDRGLAYHDKGNYDNAIADYNLSVQNNPNNPDVYYFRGIAYLYGLNDKINARRSLLKAKELGHPDAQKELDKLR